MKCDAQGCHEKATQIGALLIFVAGQKIPVEEWQFFTFRNYEFHLDVNVCDFHSNQTFVEERTGRFIATGPFKRIRDEEFVAPVWTVMIEEEGDL